MCAGAHPMASNTVQLCLITTMAGVTKGKAETIRRNFYLLLNKFAWHTPIGWIMDAKTCNEVMPKLQELAEQFAKETRGEKQLFYFSTIMMDYKELERLLQYAEEPENKDIAMRLRKILEIQRQLVELVT